MSVTFSLGSWPAEGLTTARVVSGADGKRWLVADGKGKGARGKGTLQAAVSSVLRPLFAFARPIFLYHSFFNFFLSCSSFAVQDEWAFE